MRVSRTDWRSTWAQHPLIEAPDFRSLFIGDVLITIAERYFVLVFTWWLLTGPLASGSRLSTLLTLESLPILAVGLLVGPLVDRLNKKHCMLSAALLQGAIVSGVAALLALNQLSFPILCAAGMLLGCLIPVFEGAVNAGLPQSVTKDRLLAAAAVQSSTLELSNIFAAALAASVLAAFGFEIAVMVNAGLYFAGALFLLRLRTAAFAGTEAYGAYADDLKAGLRYIASSKPLLAFVGVYIAKLLFLVPLLVLIPMLVDSVLGGAVSWVAILEAAFSIGAIATALALSFEAAGRDLYRSYAGALAILGALMFLLSRLKDPLAMLPVVAVMGACVAVLLALSNMLFHHSVPDAMKGRFFGILETLAAAATPLGYLALGVVSGWADVTGVLIANGIGLALLAAVVPFMPRATQSGVSRVLGETERA